MAQSDFDKRLSKLLHYTVDTVPFTNDLTQRIHHRIPQ